MQIHRLLVLLAALLFSATTVTACADDEHDDHGHHHDDEHGDEHSDLEHACDHLSDTPIILTAAPSLDGTVPSFSAVHMPVTVMQDETAIDEDDEVAAIGYVAFEATSHSDIIFYSEAGAPWTIETSDGEPVSFDRTDTDVEPLCGITRLDVVHLHPGTYYFRFEFSDDWTAATFLPLEGGAHDDEHDNEHDHH